MTSRRPNDVETTGDTSFGDTGGGEHPPPLLRQATTSSAPLEIRRRLETRLPVHHRVDIRRRPYEVVAAVVAHVAGLPRHPRNGQFGGQPFWLAYGPTMVYAAFPATQMVTPPGVASQQALPVVNVTAAAHPAIPAAGKQQRWMQTSAVTATPNSAPALGYVNVCGAMSPLLRVEP